jgi:hypothetical protein
MGSQWQIGFSTVPVTQFAHPVKSATVRVVSNTSQYILFISCQICSIKTTFPEGIANIEKKDLISTGIPKAPFD